MNQFIQLVDQKHIFEVIFNKEKIKLTIIPIQHLQQFKNVKYEQNFDFKEFKSFLHFEVIDELKVYLEKSKNYDFLLNDLSINFKWKIVGSEFQKNFIKKMFLIEKPMKMEEIVEYHAKMLRQKIKQAYKNNQIQKKFNSPDITIYGQTGQQDVMARKTTVNKQIINISSESDSDCQQRKTDDRQVYFQDLKSFKTKPIKKLPIKKLPKLRELKNSYNFQSQNTDSFHLQIQFQNGDFYRGSVKDNKYNGKGQYSSKKQAKYNGSWSQGKIHGYGKYQDNQKNKYQGSFVNNLRDGTGYDYYKNGDYYIGDFKKGFRQGHGTYIFVNKDLYNGEWKKDMYHGKGYQITQDRSVYFEGQWMNDLKHGKGILRKKQGKFQQVWDRGHLISESRISKNKV